jgi:hypothetical protein
VVSSLSFAVLGARAEPFALAPQLSLRILIEETTGADIYAIALRAQVMLEPQKRRYGGSEPERLVDLFGTQERYGDTLRPMLWTHASQMVLAFRGSTEIELPIPCSYDLEVAGHKYVAALDSGEIPVNVLFSGTVIERGERGVASGFVPWSCEASFRLPVAVWRETMDAHFPGAAWLRVSRETLDELQRYRSARQAPSWDAALTHLIDAAAAKR